MFFCEVRTDICKEYFSNFILQTDCAMAQVIYRQPLTAETRARPKVTSYEMLMVDEVALGQIFLQVDYFGFSLSVSFDRSSILIFIYMLPLPEGWVGGAWEPLQKNALFQESESFGLNTLISF